MTARNVLLLSIAIFGSSSANAHLELRIGPDKIYPSPSGDRPSIQFGQVCRGFETAIEMEVINHYEFPLDGFAITIPGNSKEFGFDTPVGGGPPCPAQIGVGGSCPFTIFLYSAHFGEKRKKLNFDAFYIDDGGTSHTEEDDIRNDISLTIPLSGSSDAFTPLNNYGESLDCNNRTIPGPDV